MKHFYTLFLLGSLSFNAVSQTCTQPTPPSEGCSDGGAILLTSDGITVNTGQVYYTDGSITNFNNITIADGGTLRICGGTSSSPITFDGATNFQNGTIVIRPGAFVSFQGTYNSGDNSSFFNLGTVTFNVNLSGSGLLNLQGASRVTYNGIGSTFTSLVPINANGGTFYNNGIIVAPSYTMQGGTVCMSPAASLQVGTINSLESGAVIVSGSGPSCISFSSLGTSSQPITTQTPSPLTLCNTSGTNYTGNAAIGTATLVNNCTSCEVALPLTLTSFTGNVLNGTATLQWETSLEEQLRSFIIERSPDGRQFDSAGIMAARNQPSKYSVTIPISGNNYFRLKTVDLDGRFSYSYVIVLQSGTLRNQLKILTNPVSSSYVEVSIDITSGQSGEIVVADNLGKVLKRVPVTLMKGNNAVRVPLDNISRSQYYLYYKGTDTWLKPVSFIKL